MQVLQLGEIDIAAERLLHLQHEFDHFKAVQIRNVCKRRGTGQLARWVAQPGDLGGYKFKQMICCD